MEDHRMYCDEITSILAERRKSYISEVIETLHDRGSDFCTSRADLYFEPSLRSTDA